MALTYLLPNVHVTVSMPFPVSTASSLTQWTNSISHPIGFSSYHLLPHHQSTCFLCKLFLWQLLKITQTNNLFEHLCRHLYSIMDLMNGWTSEAQSFSKWTCIFFHGWRMIRSPFLEWCISPRCYQFLQCVRFYSIFWEANLQPIYIDQHLQKKKHYACNFSHCLWYNHKESPSILLLS